MCTQVFFRAGYVTPARVRHRAPRPVLYRSNVLANLMSLECKTLPYLHVRMRGLDGVNVFKGKHSDVLPGPNLVEIILPSIRHVGQLAKQDSHHYLKK